MHGDIALRNSLTISLDKKTILITGAAGLIGSSIARDVLEAKGNVVISDLSKDRLSTLYKELKKDYSQRVFSIHADASTSHGVNELIDKTLAITKRIDGAVHAAYPTSKGWGDSFEELKSENLFQDLTMQLGGAIIFSQRILRCFKEQSGGTLIHISSIQGVSAPKFEHYEGTSMSSPVEYAAIKSGIIGITKWLAKYHNSQGIRVNCVSPGGIINAQPKSFLEKYRKDCSNIGMLSATHVASAVVFLLSSSSAAINGQNLIVDDGWTL